MEQYVALLYDHTSDLRHVNYAIKLNTEQLMEYLLLTLHWYSRTSLKRPSEEGTVY